MIHSTSAPVAWSARVREGMAICSMVVSKTMGKIARMTTSRVILLDC